MPLALARVRGSTQSTADAQRHCLQVASAQETDS